MKGYLHYSLEREGYVGSCAIGVMTRETFEMGWTKMEVNGFPREYLDMISEEKDVTPRGLMLSIYAKLMKNGISMQAVDDMDILRCFDVRMVCLCNFSHW